MLGKGGGGTLGRGSVERWRVEAHARAVWGPQRERSAAARSWLRHPR